MNLTRILLVRHGQSAKNVEGRFGGHSLTPLSELGKLQAEITAGALAKENIEVIFSSDLPRAIETAEPLRKLLNLPIQEAMEFRERDVGRLEGLTFSDAKEKYPKDYYALVNRLINYRIPGGESYSDLLARASKKLDTIIHANRGKNVVIFSHTGTICYLTLFLLNAIRANTKQTPWLVTSNCGINRFEIRSRSNIRLHALNDTRHLVENTGNDSFIGG